MGGTLRILLTGGGGQVGQSLNHLMEVNPDVRLFAPPRTELDLADPAALAHALAGSWAPGQFDLVVNAGAYTAVDQAEGDRDTAMQVNGVAPGTIAVAAAAAGVPLLHISTDYVFDGSKVSAYSEEDPAHPINVYGETKWAGEQAVRVAGGSAVIVRTAWVVSPFGRNFVKTMVRLARSEPEVRVVSDQIGTPTSALDLAQALLRIGRDLVDNRLRTSGDAPGAETQGCHTYHFVNGGQASWYDVAACVFAGLAQRGETVGRLVPIPTRAYPTPAARPMNSCLATQALTARYSLSPRPWQAAVRDIVDALA